MKSKSDGWALCDRRGIVYPDTFALTRDGCWVLSFQRLYRLSWMKQYWKRWEESIGEAEKRGYTLVRVNLRKVRR